MKKITLNKKTKIISVSLLFLVVLAVVIIICVNGLKEEEKPLSTYNMKLSYDDENHVLSGEEEITFINNYDNMFTCLYLHLYPNAFREGAKNNLVSVADTDEVYVDGVSYGNIEIKGVSSEDENLNYNIEGEDSNILKVELPVEVYPDESITFSVEFATTLANVNHRLGYGNNAINFGNFYPVICMYEEGVGFKTDLYHSNGDPFYSEVASYQVEITYPAKYTLASSGSLQSTTEEEGVATSKVSGDKIRDFCFVLSDIFDSVSQKVGSTTLTYYGYEGDSLSSALEISVKALNTFNELFGKYPYSTLNIVKTNFLHGGMEYPNLVMISDNLEDDEIAYVIVHEIAHQWWYGVVGNDEYNHAWMDEGLTEYSTLLFFEEHEEYNVDTASLVKNATESYKTFVRVYTSVNGEVDTSMDRPLNKFDTQPEYVQCTYTKGMLMFDSIRKSVGDRKFFKALKDYYQGFAYKNASPADMIASFIDSTRVDLEGFFNSWLSGDVVIK